MRTEVQRIGCGVVFLLAAFGSARVRAADTVETFDAGAIDVESYLSFDGAGLAAGERALVGAMVFGYGLAERLSVQVTSVLQTSDLQEGEGSVGVGLFGTPLDTEHVDLDLIVDVGIGGAGFKEVAVSPGLELNLDLRPDMSSCGTYARGGFAITSETDGGGRPNALSIETQIGSYCTIADEHQLLLELDLTLRPAPRGDVREVEVGGLGLGYNVAINGVIELVTQAYLDLPQSGEKVAGGVMAGFILTLPSAGSAVATKIDPNQVEPRVADRGVKPCETGRIVQLAEQSYK